MSANILSLVGQLSNQQLVRQVKLLAQYERDATAALIAHLAVLDERRLYLAEGCSSMFTYCVQVLRLSESAAYGRIAAARAARNFPVILDMIGDGSVNLTTVGLLAPDLTPENHVDLLEAARHKSKRQVEELVARLRPRPPVPSTMRRLPTASKFLATAACSDAMMSPQARAPLQGPAAPLTTLALPPTRPAVVTPLAPQRFKVQFTVSAETHSKLRLAQDLLRHQIPDGDLGQIVDRALGLLIGELKRQKFAATDRPRRSSTDKRGANRGTVPRSRHIPAEVRRTVWTRDGGQCAFVAHNGNCCAERAFLEFHHVVPDSIGGEATVKNIQLRCRAHNGYEAELYFGSGKITSTQSGPSRS